MFQHISELVVSFRTELCPGGIVRGYQENSELEMAAALDPRQDQFGPPQLLAISTQLCAATPPPLDTANGAVLSSG
jgi:hypothetical protein